MPGQPNSSLLRQLGASLLVARPTPGRVRRALRWVTPVALGLVVTALILGPAQGAMGLLGAQAANAGRDDPMRRRIITLLVVGTATLAIQAIGLLIAPHPWLVPPVMTLITLGVVWVWHALHTGPPGPINTVFAGAFGTYMGTQGWTVATLLPVTALAWGIAAGASIAMLALDPHGPRHEAVDAAVEAAAAYRDRPADLERNEADRLRARAWRAIDDAWNSLRKGVAPGVPLRSAEGRRLEERLNEAHLELLRLVRTEVFPVDRAAERDPDADATGYDPTAHREIRPLGRPCVPYLLATGAQRGARAWLVAIRGALAVLLAASTMFFSPVGHPYWAILSALIVLHMGASRADLTIRAAHRIIGTGVGVGVYFAIVLLQPNEWVRLAIVIVAIFGLEAMVTANYAIAVIFVTVFALMMTPATSPGEIDNLLRDRFVETVIGVGAAMLIVTLVGRRAPMLLVRRQYRLTLNTMLQVLGDMARGELASGPAAEHRRNLVFELGRAGDILEAERDDDPGGLRPWDALQRQVSSFGFDILAASWRAPGLTVQAAAAAGASLRHLIGTLPPISSKPIDVTTTAERVRGVHRAFLDAAREPG
ncbi:FUSC family protein [Nigerium sp.]|uniref:FUSC family protein n=1 Tax=Nigerium sp. TaxID=2042655 RepID=UPI003221482B